jgi:hypothetical protein
MRFFFARHGRDAVVLDGRCGGLRGEHQAGGGLHPRAVGVPVRDVQAGAVRSGSAGRPQTEAGVSGGQAVVERAREDDGGAFAVRFALRFVAR